MDEIIDKLLDINFIDEIVELTDSFRKRGLISLALLSKMRTNYTALVKWSIIYYLFMEVLEILLKEADITPAIQRYGDPFIVFLSVSALINFGLYSVLTYLILNKTYSKRAAWLSICLILLSIFPVVVLRYFIEEVLSRIILGFGNYKDGVSLSYYFRDNLYYAFQYIALGAVVFFFYYSKYKEARAQALQIENKQMELAILRSQINPHFLFNMLNNIYSLVYTKSEKALPAIDKLSQFLRQTLYESKDKCIIGDEIKLIEKLIELEGYRHSKKLEVRMDYAGVKLDSMIPSYVLLPFVENALKHGETKNELFPIQILLKQKDNYLEYFVKNKIINKQKDQVGGLGLESLKKRLEIRFDKDFEFRTVAREGHFEGFLKIPLV